MKKRKQLIPCMSRQYKLSDGVQKSNLSLYGCLERFAARRATNGTPMAVNLKIKVKLACPHYAISTLMLITSVIAFVGGLAMEYEFCFLSGNYLEDYLGNPIFFFIAGSAIVFANAVLGLISLYQRWRHGVIAFLACTVLLLVTMFLATMAYVFWINDEQAMFLQLEEDMKKYEINKEVVDTFQFQMKCCGYNNFSDWTQNAANIPQSCCIVNDDCNTMNSTEIQSIGCHDALYFFVCFRKWIIAVVLAVLGIIEVISIALSVTVFRDLTRRPTPFESSAVDNEERNTTLPRIHNPLAQNNALPTMDNGYRTQEPYVRRPPERATVLNYRSPHESFLRHAPQLRFDRRIAMPNTNYKNPYGGRPA